MTQTAPLIKIGHVICPRCLEAIEIYGEAGEHLEQATPPMCPDCRISLAPEVYALLIRLHQAGPPISSP